MATRRQLLSGSLATLLASGLAGCKPDPAPDSSSPTSQALDTEAMQQAAWAVLGAGWSEELAELLRLLEELRVELEGELPATAAMLAVGFNEVGLPLVRGLSEAMDAEGEAAVWAAMSAHEDDARAGLAALQALLPSVDEEASAFDAPWDQAELGPWQEGLAQSHLDFAAALGELELREHPSARALQAGQHSEAQRILAGDARLRDDLDTALRLSEVESAAKALGANSLFESESECSGLAEGKFWYTVAGSLWKLAALLGLIVGGWSAMSGITATVAVALLGGIFSLQFIWLLLILLFVWQLASKISGLLETLDACACELRGEE